MYILKEGSLILITPHHSNLHNYFNVKDFKHGKVIHYRLVFFSCGQAQEGIVENCIITVIRIIIIIYTLQKR